MAASSLSEADEEILCQTMEPFRGFEVKDRRWRLRTYKKCFVACDAISWLVSSGIQQGGQALSRGSALALLERFRNLGLIVHVCDRGKPVSDELLFFEFTGEAKKVFSGKKRTLKEGLAIRSLDEILVALKHPATGLVVKDRQWRLKTYKQCFVASEMIDWLIANLRLRSRPDAVELANKLVACGAIRHVVITQPVRDAYLFFEFTPDAAVTGLQSETKPVSIDNFTTVRVLGVGGFGRVVLAQKNDTKKLYAIKMLKKSALFGEKELRNMQSELEILKNDHAFLVHLYWSFQSETHIFLVMDYLPGGDLFFHLQKHKNGFPREVVRIFVAETILALEYLHACGIIYRDIKLENILLDADGHICLTDFGLSKPLGDAERTETMCGTPGYLAPEILSGKPYTVAVDYWSLGVLMFEISTGLNPFLAETTHKTLQNILHKPIVLPDSLFSKEAKSFLQLLLVRDPSQRLSNPDLMKEHPYFKSLDFSKLLVKKIKSPYEVTISSATDTSNFDSHFTSQPVEIDTPPTPHAGTSTASTASSSVSSASSSSIASASDPSDQFASFDYVSPDAAIF